MHLMAVVLMLTVPSPTQSVDVLLQWEQARTTAYAEADVAGLRALYADRSTAGKADVRLLEDYRTRGIAVWQRSQVFEVRRLLAEGSRFTLRVTARTLTAIGDGTRCRVLPTTLPTARDVGFVRTGDRWVVESVRPAPNGARR